MRFGVPFVSAAEPVHGRVRDDEAAITTHIEAGEDVLAGWDRSPRMLQHDVKAAAGRECIGCGGQCAVLAFQPAQERLAVLAVEVEHEEVADGTGDQADAVATDGEPVVQLGLGGAGVLERRPGHGRNFLARANRHDRPAEAGIEQRPLERGPAGSAGGVGHGGRDREGGRMEIDIVGHHRMSPSKPDAVPPLAVAAARELGVAVGGRPTVRSPGDQNGISSSAMAISRFGGAATGFGGGTGVLTRAGGGDAARARAAAGTIRSPSPFGRSTQPVISNTGM